MKPLRQGTFRYYLHIYFMILVQDLKSKLNYRADFILSIFGMLVVNVVELLSFWIVYQSCQNIVGWKYYEIMFLYGFSLLALSPVQLFFDNNWNLRNYVYDGFFIRYCLRPINIFFYYISEVFDIKGIGQLVFGIITLVISSQKLGIHYTPLKILLLLFYILSASLIMIAIMNIAAATCFWMTNSGYVMTTAFKLKDYAKYPVSIFSRVFRFIFTFIIPIGFISYYPSTMFVKASQLSVYTYLTPVVGIFFFILSYKIWMYGAKNYSGTGT